MRSILVLTDFSDGSIRAAEWGLELAEKSNSSLILFHSYLGVPVIPFDTYTGQSADTDVNVNIEEECQLELLEFSRRLTSVHQGKQPHFNQTIQTELGEGDLGKNVAELVEKENVELVVMGSTDQTGLGHLLMGNRVVEVVEKTTRPVLIVPIQSLPGKLDKVAFAVNFDDEEVGAFHSLGHLSELFNFDIDVVHVITAGESSNDATKQTFLEKLNYGNNIFRTDYHAIKGNGVLPSLYKECKVNGYDLLAMTHHRYNLLQRVFYKSTTRKAVHNVMLPLLIFSSKVRTPIQ